MVVSRAYKISPFAITISNQLESRLHKPYLNELLSPAVPAIAPPRVMAGKFWHGFRDQTILQSGLDQAIHRNSRLDESRSSRYMDVEDL